MSWLIDVDGVRVCDRQAKRSLLQEHEERRKYICSPSRGKNVDQIMGRERYLRISQDAHATTQYVEFEMLDSCSTGISSRGCSETEGSTETDEESAEMMSVKESIAAGLRKLKSFESRVNKCGVRAEGL